MRALFLVVAAALVWAMVYAGAREDREGILAWAAFVILIVAALSQFWAAVISAAGPRRNRRARDADEMLKHRIGQLFDAGLVSRQFSSASMHVWMVPVTYRIALPFKVRKFVRRTVSPHVPLYAPKLVHLTCFKLAQHRSSGITFKKGYGLVGRCLATKSRNALWVDFGSEDTKEALAGGEQGWQDSSNKITHGLTYDDAEVLAESYSQAIACAIRDRDSSEAIGVLTFETSNGFEDTILEDSKLSQELTDLAGVLAPVLSINRRGG